MIGVDFACNDPDNGLFAGRIEQIQVGSEFLELTARREPVRLVEVDDSTLRIAGRHWAYDRAKYGVGNWCWNRYWMRLDDAAALIAWLHKRRFFHCDMGEERIFNLWRKPALDAHAAALVRRLLEKEALHQAGAAA